MTKELLKNGEMRIYQTPDGSSAVDVVLAQDTVWLSQAHTNCRFIWYKAAGDYQAFEKYI